MPLRCFLSSQRSGTATGFQVLTIQSCKRGLPLVPLVTDELPTTTIVAGACSHQHEWKRADTRTSQVARVVRAFPAAVLDTATPVGAT